MLSEYISWTIPFPRVIKNEIHKIAIDEGKSMNELCRQEIEVFISSLIVKLDNLKKIRAQQQEEAQIVAEHPMIVTGSPVENRISNTNEENN